MAPSGVTFCLQYNRIFGSTDYNFSMCLYSMLAGVKQCTWIWKSFAGGWGAGEGGRRVEGADTIILGKGGRVWREVRERGGASKCLLH